MQLTDIRDAVRETAGLSNTDGGATDAVVTGIVNRAIQTINMQRDWDWLVASETITTVVGQTNYAVAADWRKTTRIVDDLTGMNVRQVTAQQGERESERTGMSLFYWIEGGTLYLTPKASTVRNYTHWYIKSETALSGDTDEPAMPDWATPLIVIKGALILAARRDNTSLHRLLKDDERNIMRAIQGEARRARGPVRIDTRSDWWGGRGGQV